MKAPLLLAAAALGLAGAAHAATPAAAAPAKPVSQCFFSRDWAGWRAPDDHTLYLRVNVRDIYQVDLVGGSSSLLWPDSHLISEVRGSDSICNPIDLDLKVANDHVVEPLFVKSLTKLTPEQVAAIPKKFLP
jgi:Family of unknown function (DUF6491)